MTATFSEEEQVSPEIAIQDFQPANEFYQPLGDDPFASEDSAPEEALDSAPGECDREAFCFHVSNDDAYIPEENLKVIQDVMKQIQIPESSIPAWAKRIPEEQWLPKLKVGIQQQSQPSSNIDHQGTDLFDSKT